MVRLAAALLTQLVRCAEVACECLLSPWLTLRLRFGKLREVDLSAVEGSHVRAGEAAASQAELAQRLREDVVAPFPHRDELLAAAATFETPYIRIPRIME